jgi:transcription antitermination protein NusB
VGRRTKARECALQMLYQWQRSGEGPEQVAEAFWRVRTTTDETKAMAERLFTGAARHRPELDEVIASTLDNWRLERVADVDKAVLRLGAYELIHEGGTPSAVVIDEAVELAKRFSEAESPAFVNGVLDALKKKVR